MDIMLFDVNRSPARLWLFDGVVMPGVVSLRQATPDPNDPIGSFNRGETGLVVQFVYQVPEPSPLVLGAAAALVAGSVAYRKNNKPKDSDVTV